MDRKSNGGVKGLSNELMQLRKICQNLFLFESVEDRILPNGVIDNTIWRCVGKFELLVRILPKLFATGHRVSCILLWLRVRGLTDDIFVFARYSCFSR